MSNSIKLQHMLKGYPSLVHFLPTEYAETWLRWSI